MIRVTLLIATVTLGGAIGHTLVGDTHNISEPCFLMNETCQKKNCGLVDELSALLPSQRDHCKRIVSPSLSFTVLVADCFAPVVLGEKPL
jgi:hypothetical protein